MWSLHAPQSGANSSQETPISKIWEIIANNKKKVAAIILAISSLGVYEYTKTPEYTSEKLSAQDIFYGKAKVLATRAYSGKYLSMKHTEILESPRCIQADVLTPWLKEHRQQYWLRKANTKKEILGKKIWIYGANSEYRLHEIGSQDSGKKLAYKNDPDYMKLHEGAYKDLLEIHERLQKKMTEAGLDDDYTPTLIITSASRDMRYAEKHLSNASWESAHLYGIAFDIRIKEWAITNLKTKQEITLKGDDHKLYLALLTQVLDEMRTEGKIFFILEGNPPHFHIMSLLGTNTDKAYLPPKMRNHSNESE